MEFIRRKYYDILSDFTLDYLVYNFIKATCDQGHTC